MADQMETAKEDINMFDMIKPSALWDWDDMFRTMDALMQYPDKKNNIETQGLKSLIHRPHNIVNVKDENGNIVAQRLEVVTTPFAKEDVKVTVEDNVLTIQCGSEKKEEKEGDEYIYKGISSQNYVFSLKLGDNIDKDKIKAKNSDGVLCVTLPLKDKEREPEKQITNIEVE